MNINPLLVAWLDCFVDFLDHWQTLIGSIIGSIVAGCIGWFAAFYVAHDARRREEGASAMLVDVELLQIISIGFHLNKHIADKKMDDAQSVKYVSTSLTKKYLKLSPLFETSKSEISHIDPMLAAHLDLFHVQYKMVIEDIEEIKPALNPYAPLSLPMTVAELQTKQIFIKKNFLTCHQHAICAHNLIDQLIIGGSKIVKRNRRRQRLGKYTYEDSCIKVLKGNENSGSSNQPSEEETAK